MTLTKGIRTRAAIALATAAAASIALAGCSAQASPTTAPSGGATGADVDLTGVTLNVGVLDAVTAKLIEDSGVFDGAPYQVNFSVATFPQQVAGLNSGQFDIAFYGITTSVNQAGNDPAGWTADNVPIKLIGGWAPDQEGEYPWFGVAVKTNAGIDSIEDLKGHTWAVSTSGDAYPTYLALLDQTGLTDKDVTLDTFSTTPEQVADFANGNADVWVSSFQSIAPLLASGEAKILTTSKELGVPVLRGEAVLTKTLDDPVKKAAIADWFKRFNEYNTTWWDENEQAVVDAYKNLGSLDETAAEYVWNSLKGTKARPFDAALLKGLQYNADLFYKFGAISNKVPDVSILVDNEFNETIPTTPLF